MRQFGWTPRLWRRAFGPFGAGWAAAALALALAAGCSDSSDDRGILDLDALGGQDSSGDSAAGDSAAGDSAAADAAGGSDSATGDGQGGSDSGGSDSGGSDTGSGDTGTDTGTDPVDASGGGDGEGGDAGVDPLDRSTTAVLLDDQEFQLNDGLSTIIPFTAPPNVQSITIVVEGQSDEWYTLDRWIDGGGETLVPVGWHGAGDPTLCFVCSNRLASSEAVFATIAPIQPESRAVAGDHVIAVFGYAMEGDFFNQKIVRSNATVRVSVYAKVLPEAPTSGTLDLNLYFSGAQGWTAASAPTSPEFQAILQRIDDIYAPVGIQLGAITYQDIGVQWKVIESVQGADSDFMQLLALSEGQKNNALNVFFVDELNLGGPFGGFGVLLGVAGGIPGPTLRQGTAKSGVAIAVKPVPQLDSAVDTTMAHEMGHFLGLFHTSEQSFGFGAQVHDPLPDTPQNDESYLMFNTGSGDLLSPFQGKVMRSNLWVRQPAGQEGVQ